MNAGYHLLDIIKQYNEQSATFLHNSLLQFIWHRL